MKHTMSTKSPQGPPSSSCEPPSLTLAEDAQADHRPPEDLRVPSAQEMFDAVTDHTRRELGDEAARDPQIIWRRFFELAVIAILRTCPSLLPTPPSHEGA